jgi:hypothetical protein
MATISDDGANQILSQLARHGYFLNHDTTRIRDDGNDNCDEDDSFETYQRLTQQQEQQRNTASDSGWQLIPTTVANDNDDDDGCCYFTPKGLVRHLIRRLQQNDSSGRASLLDLCRETQVDCRLFLTTTTTSVSRSEEDATSSSSLWKQLVEESESSSITILGSNKNGSTIQSVELVSIRYWERTLEKTIAMVEEQGSVSVSDVMTLYSLSRDAILNHLVVVRGNKNNRGVSSIDGSRMRLMKDSKELVSESYCRSLRQRVLKYFACIEEPTQIDDVCQEQDWDWDQVLEWLTTHLEDQDNQTKKDETGNDITTTQEKLDNNETAEISVKGEIHMDDAACGQTAMYLPTSYRTRQQQEILEFLAANGYITMERAVRNYRQGFLGTQITTLVRDAFPDVAVLNDGHVFITDSILQQVQVGIQDYLSPSSAASDFLDLQEYLPAELLQSSTIVLIILEKIGFTLPSDGIAVIGNDRAIVVSKEVIQQVKDKHLSQLIQKHAKIRANEISQTDFAALDEDDNDNEEDEGFTTGRKAGKSTRSKRKTKHSKHNNKRNQLPKGDDASSCLVSLSAIVSIIIDAYPAFQEDALSPDDMKEENMKWDDDDDQACDSVLAAQFCRKAFYSETLLEQCQRAVTAELRRLESEKNSKAKMSRKDAAAKVRSVEAAFQDAFVTLCYLIQAQSKSLVYFSNNLVDCFDEASLEKLKDDFLQGPCADLTSRITQHCLFQEEAEEVSTFTFVHPTSEGEDNNKDVTDNAAGETEQFSSGLPRHCIDVTITARRHCQSYLSSPPPREPLPALRESFSGNTGIVLSKMWVLCGGECYRGGVRTIKDDDEEGASSQSIHVRAGNMDVFLSHAEENCLTLCGLPYKKLDKKAEKSFLFSRKQQLNGLLSSTDVAADAIGVLEYTIMILFQQVRSLIVSGSMLCGPILEALSRERKIPSSVGTALKLLNEMIKDDDKAIDEELVSLVKECGLVRDISKHDTAPIEGFLAHQ